MTHPFEITKKVEAEEYHSISEEIVALKKDLEKNPDQDQQTETKDAIAKAEAKLLKHKQWIEVDLGMEIADVLENDDTFSFLLRDAFQKIIVNNPDYAQYKNHYDRVMKKLEAGGDRTHRSELVAILQLFMVLCHQQSDTLQGFATSSVQYRKIRQSVDGLFGGRTLKAMMSIALDDLGEGSGSIDSVNFLDEDVMGLFLVKMLRYCGYDEIPDGLQKTKKVFSTTPLATLSASPLPVKYTLPKEDISSLKPSWHVLSNASYPFDFDDVADVVPEKKIPIKRACKKLNSLHRVGGVLDTTGMYGIYGPEQEAKENLSINYARMKKQGKDFIALAKNAEYDFSLLKKEPIVQRFYEIFNIFDRIKKGKVINGHAKQKALYKLVTLKTILQDDAIASYLSSLDLQSVSGSFASDNENTMNDWKNSLAEMQRQELLPLGGISESMVDVLYGTLDS